MEIKKSIVILLSPFLIKLLFGKILGNINLCMKSLLISQKISEIFNYFTIINFLVFFISSYITIMIYELILDGFIISFYLKLIIELLVLIIMICKFSYVYFIKPEIKEIFKNLGKILNILYIFFLEFLVAFFLLNY